MTKGAAIYGAGGHGRVVASILLACKTPILGFFDDQEPTDQTILGSPVLGSTKDIPRYSDRITAGYLAIGDNIERAKAFKALARESVPMPPLVHPSATVEADAELGQGTVVCMGALVATGVTTGRGCIINTGASVDHESILGDFVHLAPRAVAAGRVTIDELTFVAMGVAIAQGLKIGRLAAIGANAVVLRDVPSGSKIVGVHH